MRLRNIPGSEEALLRSPYVIDDPQTVKGKWHELFGNDHPIRLEIGMGKGQFIIEMANRHPDVNFIGIEMYSSVLVRAVQKLSGGRHVWEDTNEDADGNTQIPSDFAPDKTGEETKKLAVANLRLIRLDARELCEVFADGEVERIYLNFSDPWPKDRHAKRRLPSKQFLSLYDRVLIPEGKVEFKTDNRDLFDFAIEQLPLAGWKADIVTYDLHADPALMEENVMTEYEQKFSA
ncbi:MAG: tRNA (guanosine(46)-N7)-methyltransferase TrmB, partial [Lachnospiraceae bacterium]|nr:tRNA (guanosine(46)-N7)-methyltransferase TrmB [Lachnospiraceae bacterium]